MPTGGGCGSVTTALGIRRPGCFARSGRAIGQGWWLTWCVRWDRSGRLEHQFERDADGIVPAHQTTLVRVAIHIDNQHVQHGFAIMHVA